MHHVGQLEQAALLYQEVLSQDEMNSSALHMFGVLHHQRGDDPGAVALIVRALALQPSAPTVHANLAEVYRTLGQLERAVNCCLLALKLWPDCPEALCNLGLSLHMLGRREEAVVHFRRALELHPDLPLVHNNLGIVLRELHLFEEAIEHFRRAVELDPTLAPARTNLGQMLLGQGHAEEALPHCEEAARLQPEHPAVHHNLGNALQALGRSVEARAAYLEALRLDPELALSHAHLGMNLLHEGQLAAALPWIKNALELDPEDPTFQEYLGNFYMESREYAKAVPCFQRALALASEDRLGPHLSLGIALELEGRLVEAEEQYHIALRLQPDSAAALVHLGGLHQVYGNVKEAEATLREALAVQPKSVAAHTQLASLLRGGLSDEDLSKLEKLLSEPLPGKEARANLLFSRALVLDARGDYAGAAECLREANALASQTTLGHCDCTPSTSEPIIGGLMNVFNSDYFARIRGLGLITRRPVFVFGLPRSGTTLVEQVLASHSLVHGAGELQFARRTFEAIPDVLGCSQPPLDCIPHLDATSVHRVAQQHLDWLSTLCGGAVERIVDKMPGNYIYLGLLVTLFPQATFIHCRRDLRDVAVSCWITDFRVIPWANTFEGIVMHFKQYCRLMNHWRAILPVRVHEVNYEDTVADIGGVARRLVAACDLEWEPACLEFYRTKRPVQTASVTQVRQPIYRHSVGRWKNYEEPLADLFAKLPFEEEEPADNQSYTQQFGDPALATA
jgi:tetratricopeptide (TPR) repeat protein